MSVFQTAVVDIRGFTIPPASPEVIVIQPASGLPHPSSISIPSILPYCRTYSALLRQTQTLTLPYYHTDSAQQQQPASIPSTILSHLQCLISTNLPRLFYHTNALTVLNFKLTKKPASARKQAFAYFNAQSKRDYFMPEKQESHQNHTVPTFIMSKCK